MKNETVMYRWILIVCVAALIVFVSVVWFDEKNDPEVLTENFKAEALDYRDVIREKCTFTATTTLSERLTCEETLDEFSDIIRRYRRAMVDAIGTTTLPQATSSTSSVMTSITTPSTTGEITDY